MGLSWAAILALGLILGLFAVATVVEARGAALERYRRVRHAVYTIGLGVYCTSWTFYGAVGSAVRDGWTYLPIYAAPIAFLALAPRFLARLAEAVAAERATTASDFIAARFGHDTGLARLVTVTALLGSVPYIALQLRSIGSAIAIVSGQAIALPAMVGAALTLALFGILFGARRFELAGRSEGLLYAIGLDSLFKLIALVAIAGCAVGVMLALPAEGLATGVAMMRDRFSPSRLSLEVVVISLISATAIITLPRQFYMGLVEARQPGDLTRARPGLIVYLLLMALLILPVALAGEVLLGADVPPDQYVLRLPAAAGEDIITALALLGGLSAAASMAIVETTALATMVSNDLVFPSILRDKAPGRSGEIGRLMLAVRRFTILAIMLLALGWASLVSPKDSLASIGLIAFAAMAQFTPHLILATLGKDRDALAGRASLGTGLVIWLYTLALPPVLPRTALDGLAAGPLDPLRLFGIGDASPLVHGVIWSLGCNLAVFALVTARKVKAPPLPRFIRGQRQITDLSGLVQLTASFVGQERAEAEFPGARRGMPIDGKAARRARALIAGVVGASSARALVASALAGGTMNLQEVTRLLDEGGQSLRFSRELLASTFENLDAGISVVDADLNLVAWNSRYLDMFDYPPGMVRVGAPVADLIRHNALRGDFGEGDTEFHVTKRLDHLRRGLDHSFERRRVDGRVIKTVGGPMPGGGYVMSFTDITEEAHVREELRHTLEGLEQRVAERTEALSAANRRLAEADRDKTRFLAAASHDLLQPLHAARLFTAALQRDVPDGARPLVGRVESAIQAADDLLRALLDISKLDAGGVQPEPEPVALAPFLAELVESFRPQAEAKGLALRLGPLSGTVETDPGLLRSVVQNFLANAVRYTPEGAVLVGTRRRGDAIRIDIVDTGVGIEAGQLGQIFREFTRLGRVEAEGFGLGLALVERIARLIGGAIDVRSVPGRGSRFSLTLPAAAIAVAPRAAASVVQGYAGPLRVLVVDNDALIVEATSALLDRIGHRPFGVGDAASALALAGEVDAVLVDYRLAHGEDGLSLVAALRQRRPAIPALLITAESSPALIREAGALGVGVVAKPASADQIAAFLARVSVGEVEPH